MEPDIEKRARELANVLENAGENCGFLILQGTVVRRCFSPSSSLGFTDSPEMKYDESDLNNAVELNLIEKRKVTVGRITGSAEFEWYCATDKYANQFLARPLSGTG